MENSTMRITLNTQKMILSGSRRFYKSEGFILLTKKIMSVDAFVSRVAETVFYYGFVPEHDKSYAAVTEDGRYTLYFCRADGDRLSEGDIVFYKFLCSYDNGEGIDRSLLNYILTSRTVNVDIVPISERPQNGDLEKIYLVSGGDGSLNFPLLSCTQKKIVQTENANMLVQGVAGSGKTNVCVEKVVYCACREYKGRVLYTTFSRGLLTETKNRVELFIKNIQTFLRFYESGNAVFIDGKHRQAIENKLGILFDTDDDAKIVASLKRIESFLKEKVDYKLIEDLYADSFKKAEVFGEHEFLTRYLGDKNYRLSGALEKIKHIAPELIYKEIYGMISGKFELSSPAEKLTREEYIKAREDSFTRAECDTIYTVACDFKEYLSKNGYTDNNQMSRELIKKVVSPVYSVGIIDEAQDFTQVNLCLIKKLCRKLFCVGDALQMINPSYFSFSYIKRLMYGDSTGICELKHNYRSTKKIEEIAQKLGELNRRRFGTHSFVLNGESVPSAYESAAIFTKQYDFAKYLNDGRFENVTLIVSSRSKKEELKKRLKKMEILTVAEAKGLERNTVVLLDVLSDNADKWKYLEQLSLNRKTADENSVFRYYFNLFYVGISRAKQYLFVAESYYPESFEELFTTKFERKNKDAALSLLYEVAGKIELDDEEICDRIEKFCSLEQYDNARYAADRLSSDKLRAEKLCFITVHERHLRYGRYREAGMEYWRQGFDALAREMFTKSGDERLFPLMDACKSGGGALDVDIVKFYPVVNDNEVAKNLILETLKGDYDRLTGELKQIKNTLKDKRRNK